MVVKDLLEGQVQLVGHDLGERGAQALANLAVGGQNLHGAVLILVQPRHGLDEVTLTGAGEARAVEVHGKADAPAVASGLRLGVLLVLAAQVAGLVHLVHHGGQRDREVIFAGGRGSVALLDKVRFFEFKCIHTEVLGDVIHHHLHGEEGLRRAEAAISAAGCGVGLERPAMNMKVFNVVHAVSTDDAAL